MSSAVTHIATARAYVISHVSTLDFYHNKKRESYLQEKMSMFLCLRVYVYLYHAEIWMIESEEDKINGIYKSWRL